MINWKNFKIGDIVIIKKYMDGGKEFPEFNGIVGKIKSMTRDFVYVSITDFCKSVTGIKDDEVFLNSLTDEIEHFAHSEGEAKISLNLSYDTLKILESIVMKNLLENKAVEKRNTIEEVLEKSIRFF